MSQTTRNPVIMQGLFWCIASFAIFGTTPILAWHGEYPSQMDRQVFLCYDFFMPVLQEHHSKRFHITLQVPHLRQGIRDYSEILGSTPCWVIPGRLALWRTGELNFLLRANPKQRTAVLQLGWEFDYLENTQHFKDGNQLSWLFFATGVQNSSIHRLGAAYNEQSDFPLELHNPDAQRHFWNLGSLGASLVLLLGMLAFTFWNNDYLKSFFRSTTEADYVELEDVYSTSGLLRSAGNLLEAAGYAVSYHEGYGLAEHSQQARITFQIVNQHILFRTHWALPQKIVATSTESDESSHINAINRNAVLCRYYRDKEGDLAVEAYFALPPLLLWQNGPVDTQQALNAELELARQQAALQWQKTLSLWQQESLSWIEDSPLFGGSLEPDRDFRKK